MRQVDIPFDYFQKLVIREYHNWKLAFIRELLQNSVDAGSTKIEINYDGTYITFSDNGSGMTKEIIQTALLKLGGSHKENDEAVGGMGNAKNVIYLAWPEWEVTSTECTVVGQGPKYEFNDKFCDRGVISKIKVEGKLGDIKNLIEGYLSKCDTNVAIFYNNELVPSDTFSKGEKVYEIEGPLFFSSTDSFLELFKPEEDPEVIIIDFAGSKVIDQSALKAIEDIADKYNSFGKKVKLRHLTKDCHRLLSRAGQLVVDSDDDPDYGIAVDYDVKLGIFGR